MAMPSAFKQPLSLFLIEQGIPFYEKGTHHDKHLSEGWLQMQCPICGGSKLWLGYNKKKGYFNCYAHGKCSPWSLFKAWFPNQNVTELLQQVDLTAGFGVIRNENPYDSPSGAAFLPPQGIIPLCYSDEHCEYLRTRHLDPEQMQNRYAVGAIKFCADRRYSNRLFFPVFNSSGTPVSWQTRTIHADQHITYLAAGKLQESQSIKTILYGEQNLTSHDTVIVTEGVFDMLRINSMENNHAVCCFGKSITRPQFLKIAQYIRRIICFDKDAQADAIYLCTALSAYPGRTDNFCINAKDPADASDEEIQRLLEFAS